VQCHHSLACRQLGDLSRVGDAHTKTTYRVGHREAEGMLEQPGGKGGTVGIGRHS
jgi:hypothetical protein